MCDRPVQSASWALLNTLKCVGYRPAGKRSRRGHRLLAEISSDFLVRATDFLAELQFDERARDPVEQPCFDIVSSLPLEFGLRRRRATAFESLKKSLLQRRLTVPRDRAVNILDIQEVAVHWSATLALRGWRGVADYKFMEMLKKEVRWIMLEYGYHLASGKSIHCPFINAWQDHEFWRHICILDGVSEAEIGIQSELLRRSSCVRGCPGYPAEQKCIQAPLDMSA